MGTRICSIVQESWELPSPTNQRQDGLLANYFSALGWSGGKYLLLNSPALCQLLGTQAQKHMAPTPVCRYIHKVCV